MVEKHLSVPRTARVYYNTEKPSSQCQYVWICLHGYGQLGQYFSRNFTVLDPEQHWVVVPEGLSRMYLEGVYGRVGASWMTKEDRLTEIKDYMQYLDILMKEVGNAAEACENKPKLVVFGFSQGAATACRWVLDGDVRPEHLVLWSGIFPPDLHLTPPLEKSLNIWQLIGDEDEYVTEGRMQENSNIIQEMGFSPNHIDFKGGHRIYPEVLKDLEQSIRSSDQ